MLSDVPKGNIKRHQTGEDSPLKTSPHKTCPEVILWQPLMVSEERTKMRVS